MQAVSCKAAAACGLSRLTRSTCWAFFSRSGLALADGAQAGQAIQPALGPGEEERIDDQQQNKKGAQHQWGSPG